MKRSPLLALTAGVTAVSLLVLAGTISAAPAKTLTLDATLLATIDGPNSGSWRCGFHWALIGRTSIRAIGMVDLDGEYADGCVPDAIPPTSIRTLELVLLAPNGDKLVLAEDARWPTAEGGPAATWSVDSERSTGRFASYVGSGSYTIEQAPPNRVTVHLQGTLTIAR